MSDWLYVVCCAFAYLAGAAISYGIRGGIRDGAEGIGDSFIVFAWPSALVFVVAMAIVVGFNRLGAWLGGR